MSELLDESGVASALGETPGWERDGAEIVRTFKFPSYMGGIEFANQVAGLAEAANHHPDMLVGWRKVTLRLSTHSKGGLTEKDFALARQINAVVS